MRVRTATRVTEATADGFTLADGGQVTASLKVWAAGVKAPGLAGAAGRSGGLPCQPVAGTPSLQTTRDPRIFAIGDCASLTLLPGNQRPLPPTAQVAHQQAQHLIRHLPGWRATRFPPSPIATSAPWSRCDYDAFGSLGKFGLFKGLTIRGRLAQLSHALLYRSHQARLFGFWRGGLLWLVDRLNTWLRAPIRLD